MSYDLRSLYCSTNLLLVFDVVGHLPWGGYGVASDAQISFSGLLSFDNTVLCLPLYNIQLLAVL